MDRYRYNAAIVSITASPYISEVVKAHCNLDGDSLTDQREWNRRIGLALIRVPAFAIMWLRDGVMFMHRTSILYVLIALAVFLPAAAQNYRSKHL